MASWTAMARRPVLDEEDAELHRINVGSDVSDGDCSGDGPRTRTRWTVPAVALGAALGLAAVAAAAAAAAAAYAAPRAPLPSSAGPSRGPGAGARATVLTDGELEGGSAGPSMLHVADLSTFESKATLGASCEIPCGGGTCSSALDDLLDETTDSMPPGSDPSCGNAQELVKQQCPLCFCCGDMCALPGNWLGAAPPAAPCASPYTIPITLRDFNRSHPDFEQPFTTGLCKGLVEPVLAPDFTPVLSSNAGSLPGNCGRTITSFPDWYHDKPVNFPVQISVTLCQNSNGFYEYDDTAYFPLDGKAWDERLQGKPDHNYHMTMHFNNFFNMVGGEEFTFRGDDDVWVYFSKCNRDTGACDPSILGIDLGGVHGPIEQKVNLEDYFNVGDYVRMDFFWAERHTTESNLRIVTNIIFDTETTTTSRTSTTRTMTSVTTTTNTDTETTLTRTATTTTMTATTITATTTTEKIVVPTTSAPPSPCEDGCDGKTCAAKLEEIVSESGGGSSPPMTVPEAVLVLLKMCPNCASCDPSGICPQVR